MFEVFWFSHHLFLPFYIITSVHAMGNFYQWIIGPLFLYLVERAIRIFRSSRNCIVTHVIGHPSNVIELRMKKMHFDYISGQYVFISCPFIANFEWHPFTISSSPDEDFFSVHIRKAGDWTSKLHEFLNPENNLGIIRENIVNSPDGKPILKIDGSFGAASEEFTKFEYLHLWAAGIGATPFASILKSLKFQIETGTCKIKMIEFYWINRDQLCFEWFLELLEYLEQNCDFLKLNLFFTGKAKKKSSDSIEDGLKDNIVQDNDDDNISDQLKKYHDPITGLRTKTKYCRPDINAIYKQKAIEYDGCTVGVFFCGPPVVSKALYKACCANTNTSTNTLFKYHKENF